jgi:hypothetical protein
MMAAEGNRMRTVLDRPAAAVRRILGGWLKPRARVVAHYDDGALLVVERGRVKSGSREAVRRLRMGPNHVHVFVTHADGTLNDLGISTNLLTNIGRDVWAQSYGFIPPAQGTPATAVTATSLTATGTPWTASNLATPQLGLAGLRVFAPVTGVTTAPCYANIISNTTSVLTLDQWWNAADGVATTPAGTNSFIIAPGGAAAFRFVALTTNATAPAATDTTLAGEITTGGCGRALGTYAHTLGAATLTLTKAFSVSATFTAIHKAGVFSALSSAGADPMIFESALNLDATVGSGDTLTLTWSATLSG